MEMMNLTALLMLMSKMFYLLEVMLGEKKVMETQNAVMSVVTNGNIMSNTGEMLRRLEWLNIENQARLQTCY